MSARLAFDNEVDARGERVQSGLGLSSARVLCVLGMHRSGTSLATGLITTSGITPGDTSGLLPASPHNTSGYFEQRAIMELNDEILSCEGASWWAPPASTVAARPEWVARARDVAQAVGITGHDERLSVFKDPRVSLMWPVWSLALRRSVFPLLVTRHPLDIARSLWLRDAMPVQVGLALWEHYICSVMAGLDGQEAQLVQYDALVNQPGEAVRWLADLLDTVGLDDAIGRAENACARLLNESNTTPTSQHYSSSEALTQHQLDLWSALASVPNGTMIAPRSFLDRFQLSPTARDTLVDYCERTKLVMSKGDLEREVCQLRESAETAALATTSLEEQLAQAQAALVRAEERNHGLASALTSAEESARLRTQDAEQLRGLLATHRDDQQRFDVIREDLTAQIADYRDRNSSLELTVENVRGAAAGLARSHREALTRHERAAGELTHMHETVVTGLRAEIHRLGTEQHLMHESWTWKVGRFFLAPLTLVRWLAGRRKAGEASLHD